MNLNLIIEYNFNFEKRKDILKELNKTTRVKFALFCARLVQSKIECSDKDRKTIDDALSYLESVSDYDNLTKKQVKEIEKVTNAAAKAANAAKAAYTVVNTAKAANAAYYTINAAYYATYYTANVVNAAAASAAYAAYAAANVADNSEEAKQQMMAYLRLLVVASLSEEDRANELLMMSI